MSEVQEFLQQLREESRKIAPDYPNISQDLSPYEHLWAITSSYEGTKLANEDCHRYIRFLLEQLGWTPLEGIERYQQAGHNLCNHKLLNHNTPGGVK